MLLNAVEFSTNSSGLQKRLALDPLSDPWSLKLCIMMGST